jgi:hypothetical protein
MIQQINLYQDVLNKNQSKPVASTHTYGVVLTLLLFLGFSIYLLIDQSNTKERLQKAQQQLSDAEIEVQQLQVQYPSQQVDPLITQEISRLQNILTSLSQVVYLLSDNKSDQTQGFSKYFSALAKQSISDVWITDININAEQNNLSLQGSTFKSEKIPVFLQKLHNEPAFTGRTFATLTVSKTKETSKQLDFYVGTTVKTSEKANSNE